VGALAPHVPENWNPKKAFQLDSLLMAQGFWDGVQALSGLNAGYGRLGRLQPIADEAGLELARRREATAAELWQDHAVWEVIPAETAGNFAPRSPTGWLVHDSLSGRMHPRRACAALAGAVQALGGVITTQAAPEGKVVWATGWEGLQDLSQEMGRALGNGVKGQALLLDHDARGAPQLFAEALHIIPHGDGTTAIGSTSEREFDDPNTVDEQCDGLLAKTRAICPALEGAQVLERWAGVRPRARSRAPMLGPHPLHADM
ncbi:MAG: FAD-binding oxidoreductase, partial [Mangrovicoccus sp.]|nr:FAD-binding oxidoreductase [Mangrovicoccus sp.]